MFRGHVKGGRIDVNYWHSTTTFEKLYSQPKFPLVPLRDLVVGVQYGISERATSEVRGVPILRMNNLQAEGWDLDDLKYIELEDSVKQQFLLQPGDLLFNRTNSKELVGKCDVFVEEGEWVFASYLIRVRANREKVDPFFISEFLGTDAGRLQIARTSRQIIGMTNINAEELKDLVIPLPSPEQQYILLAELHAAREQRRRKLAEADVLLSTMDEWLLDKLGISPTQVEQTNRYALTLSAVKSAGRIDPFYHLPQFRHVQTALVNGLFPLVRLEEICFPPVGGATPSRSNTDLYDEQETGVPFLRIMNIKPNEIDMSTVKYITPDVHEGELQRSQLAPGDVLMTITGRVGTAAVLTPDLIPANINQHIVRLRVKIHNCLPEYLAAYLNTKIGLTMSNRSVTGGTRIALDYSAIRNIQIPLPDDEKTQQDVVDEVHRRSADALRLRAEAEAEWNTAKAHFEAQLLSGGKS